MPRLDQAAPLALLLAALLAQPLAAETAVSPFLPPGQKKEAPPPPPPADNPLDDFEFNGIFELGDTTRVSLYDPKEKKSYWLELNKFDDSGLVARDYRSEDESILVSRSGASKRLILKNADIVVLDVSRAQPQPDKREVQTGPEAPNMESASDEEVRKRMQRVAEEIRRRRALRRQMIEERRREASSN